jgi:hypothetical protein
LTLSGCFWNRHNKSFKRRTGQGEEDPCDGWWINSSLGKDIAAESSSSSQLRTKDLKLMTSAGFFETFCGKDLELLANKAKLCNIGYLKKQDRGI